MTVVVWEVLIVEMRIEKVVRCFILRKAWVGEVHAGGGNCQLEGAINILRS